MAAESYLTEEIPRGRLSASDHLVLKELVNRIQHIKYLQPDGRPNSDWKIFYAPTWGEAWRLAQNRLDELDIRQGMENQPFLQNISRLAAIHDCELFGNDFISDVTWAACYTAQEAIRPLVASEEWGRALFDRAEYTAEEDLVPHKSGGLTNEVRLSLCNLLVDLQNATPDETARDSAIHHAGEDAWLLARLHLTKTAPFFQRDRHLAHAEERLNVWEKGYALAGDCCGRLYVYCNARPQRTISVERVIV